MRRRTWRLPFACCLVRWRCRPHYVAWLIAWALLCGSVVDAENFIWGPLHMTVGVNVGVKYTDNVKNNSTPKEDFGIECGPTFNGDLKLPVRFGDSPEEQLTLATSFGFTYRYWLSGGQETSFNSPIGAVFALPVHFGEWLVTVNDNFSFRNDPLESLVAVGTRSSSEYSNNGSIMGTRRFGLFALTLSGQRSDKWAPQNPSTDETTYSFLVTPSVFLRETLSVFWANSVGFVFPKDHISRSDGINLTSMVGVSGMITPAISGSVGVGYAHSQFDPVQSHTATNSASGGTDGVTANIGLSYANPLRPNTTHAISMFYSPGVTATMLDSNYQTTYGTTYSITHLLSRSLTMAPQVGWTHSQSESGLSQQAYDIIFVGVNFSRTFTRHLTGILTYRYQDRMSPQPNQNYQVNEVRVNFQYTF